MIRRRQFETAGGGIVSSRRRQQLPQLASASFSTRQRRAAQRTVLYSVDGQRRNSRRRLMPTQAILTICCTHSAEIQSVIRAFGPEAIPLYRRAALRRDAIGGGGSSPAAGVSWECTNAWGGCGARQALANAFSNGIIMKTLIAAVRDAVDAIISISTSCSTQGRRPEQKSRGTYINVCSAWTSDV